MNDKLKAEYFSLQPEFLSYTPDEWKQVLPAIPVGMIEAMNFVMSVDQQPAATLTWDPRARKYLPQEHNDFGFFNTDAFLQHRVIETYLNRAWEHKLRFDGSWCVLHRNDVKPSRLSELHASIRKKIMPYDALLREHMPESFEDKTRQDLLNWSRG